MASHAIGVVRRMDELGRVVIPKEVRRSYRIGESEPLEIFVEGTDKIVLRKYHSGPNLASMAQEYADVLHKTFDLPVLVEETETIIAVAGLSKREYLNKPVPDSLAMHGQTGHVTLASEDEFPFAEALVESVALEEGTGRIMLLSAEKGRIGPAEEKSLQAAATFITNWRRNHSR